MSNVCWSDEDYINLEPIIMPDDLFKEIDDEIQFPELPDELRDFLLVIAPEDLEIIISNWDWLNKASLYGYEMGDENAERIFSIIDGEIKPESRLEKLWERAYTIICNWNHINEKLQQTIKIKNEIFLYSKYLESINENESTSILIQFALDLMDQNATLQKRLVQTEEYIHQNRRDHESEIQEIRTLLSFKRFRLSEKINGRFTIFDRLTE